MRNTHGICLKLITLLLVLLSSAVFTRIVHAETKYVSDQLYITLREGRGTEYKIIRTLKTGTPLEVLEEGERYMKVRTENGLEGWVLKQYVTDETPKPQIIADLEKKIDQLNATIEQYERDKQSLQDELESTRSDLNKEIMDLRQNMSAIRQQAEQAAGELEDITGRYNSLVKNSKDVLQLVNERDSLKESNNRLQAEAEQLRKENAELERKKMIWWFGAGAGVLFIGWIIGKASRQKRYY